MISPVFAHAWAWAGQGKKDQERDGTRKQALCSKMTEQRKLIESWILEFSCRCLCKEFVNNDEEDKMSDVMESNFKLITDILRQYSTEDLSGVQTTYVLLAELCVRIQEKRYQDQNDDRENQGSWNVCDCITFLGKELKISNNRTSKLVSAFEEMNIGKGNEQNGTLDAGGQEKRQSFVKEVKAFADEICKKLGLSFLEEIANLIDQVQVPNRLSQEDLISLFKEHIENEVSNEENESVVPKLKTYKRLYNAKRNILVDMDPDSTAANAPLPSSIDTTSSKSSDGFRSFFPTKKKFAGGYGIPKNKKKSRKETEVVNDTPVNEMQEEVESSDGSTVVSHSKRMRSRIRIDSSESEQSGVGKDAYPTRQREKKREATKSGSPNELASNDFNVDESNIIDVDDGDKTRKVHSNHTRRSPSKIATAGDDNAGNLKKLGGNNDCILQGGEADGSDILNATSEKSRSTRRSPRSPAKIACSECDDSEDETGPVVSDQTWMPEADEAKRIDDTLEALQTTCHTLQPPTKVPRQEIDDADKFGSTRSDRMGERILKRLDTSNILDSTSKNLQFTRHNLRSPSKLPIRDTDSLEDGGCSGISDAIRECLLKEVDESNVIDATSKTWQSTRRNAPSPAKVPTREKGCQDEVSSDRSDQTRERLSKRVDEANIIDATSKTWQSTRRKALSPAKVPRREKGCQDEVGSDRSDQTMERLSKQVDEANIIDATSKTWQSTRRNTQSPAKKLLKPESDDRHSEVDSPTAHRYGERLLKEVDRSNMIETGDEYPTKLRMLRTPPLATPKQDKQDIISEKELPQRRSPSVRISPLRASDVTSSQEQNSRERHVTRGWKTAAMKKRESSPAVNRVRTSRKTKYSDIFGDISNESGSENSGEEIDKENDYFEPAEILQQTKRNESKWKSTRVLKTKEQPRRKQQPKDVSFEFSSEEEVPDSILEEDNVSSTVKHGGRRRFTHDEEEYMRRGVRRFGVGHWKEILARYPFQNRTSVNLKDKWRNMVKNGQT